MNTMKRFRYSIFLLALAACPLLFGSCEKEQTEGVDLVETTRIKQIGHRTAVCVGYVRGVYAERGVRYADTDEPYRVVTLPDGGGGDTFEATLTGLETGHTYTCCVYALANGKLFLGEAKTFRTLEEGAPYLLTGEAAQVGHRTATLDGYVFTNGGQEILERGFCYGTAAEPTLEDETSVSAAVEGGLGRMTYVAEGLTDKTDYHARIYLRTAKGLFYSPAVEFRTRSYNKPRIAITGFERRGEQIVVQAEASAAEPADEELEIACGVIVGTTDDPTQGTVYTAEKTTFGKFEVAVPADRDAGYIWAWAGNKEGREISNAATSRASIRLEEGMDIRSRWFAPAFTIENLGILEAPVEEAGVCWSETGEPTLEGGHRAFSAHGAFTPATYRMPLFYGLKAATTYRVRAYVTNSYGTAYSRTAEITTAPDLFDTHVRVTSRGGQKGPDFNAWQVICNDHNTGGNNVPRESLTPFFGNEIYGGWVDACDKGYGTVMNGIIYKLSGETDGLFKLDVLFYYRKTVSASATQFTSYITFSRNADGSFRFRDFSPHATIAKAKTEQSREQLRRMFTYFNEHDFYFEWGIPQADFEKRVAGTTTTGSENKTDGPIWMVPVDEPQNYWTFTDKHYK